MLCTLLGIVLGAVPRLVHGPIHEKFDVLYIKGVVAVWAWYTARSAILGGTVHTQLVQDVATGRLIGGSRIDPTGNTHYTFSYTTIFAPIALP